MINPRFPFTVLYLLLVAIPRGLHAFRGESDPIYQVCVEKCETSGCIEDQCLEPCKFLYEDKSVKRHRYADEPVILQWKQWDCRSDCRYHCMVAREAERRKLGGKPVKYHGKWAFQRVYGIQEPLSVLFSVLNLASHFHGWVSLVILLYYKLPLRPDKKPYYEYTGLWHIYAILIMNSWLWSCIIHFRDLEVIQRVDYSSAVATLGYSLVLAIVRAFSVNNGAIRLLISAPIAAFVATHIYYLHFSNFDYGPNTKFCAVIGVTRLLIWIIWVCVTRHPARFKLLVAVVGGALSMQLQILDFPPYYGYLDAHALWHAATFPLAFVWWDFIKEDAQYRTSVLLHKLKDE